MRFLPLTLLCFMLNAFSSEPTLEYPSSPPTKILGSITANPTTTNVVESEATNIIFQSRDGGQTWQDISQGLPESEQPDGFFAGESEVYLRVNNKMYRSKSNLKTPDWEKVDGLDPQSASIVFNRSGVVAYNYQGEIYQKTPSAGTWQPIHTNFRKPTMRTIFETSDGTVFMGYDHGLYKSADKGKSWKQVQNEGWVMNIVESEDVLIATGQGGIMRSTDKGEHWQFVIREGGVGIAIERIQGGFAAISYNTTSKSRRMRISLDKGKTWKAIDEGLKPSMFISSIKQIGGFLLCGHPDGIFRSSDLGKTWNLVLSSVDEAEVNYAAPWISEPNKNVFRLYVSGNVLYAVSGGGGC
jgi:photosystem II stability/assembly factor-like uncharacterized protein